MGVAPVAGVLAAAIAASGRGQGLICPAAQGGEAAKRALEIAAAGRHNLLMAGPVFRLIAYELKTYRILYFIGGKG